MGNVVSNGLKPFDTNPPTNSILYAVLNHNKKAPNVSRSGLTHYSITKTQLFSKQFFAALNKRTHLLAR